MVANDDIIQREIFNYEKYLWSLDLELLQYEYSNRIDSMFETPVDAVFMIDRLLELYSIVLFDDVNNVFSFNY